MVFLVIGLIGFIGIHSVRIVAPDWRLTTIGTMGENKWKAIYSIVSLISFVLLIYGYARAKIDASQVYVPFSEMYHVVLLLMAIAFVMMMVSNLGPGYIKRKFKHPFLLATILWSISHLWMNGDLASLILFGTFLLWAIVNLKSALGRPKAEPVEPLIRNDIIAVVTGLGLYVLFIWKFHLFLFGVMPVM